MPDRDERIVSLHAGYLAQGDYVDAYVARPADGKPRPGVVLLSGMYGLSWTQREITRLYARAGFVALSPDYLGGQRPKDAPSALHIKNSLDVNTGRRGLRAALPCRRTTGPRMGDGIERPAQEEV